MTLEDVLKDAYDSEINISIQSFWDSGYEVRLGDDCNGYHGQTFWAPADKIKHVIIDLILLEFPNSEFSKKYTHE